MKKNIRNNKTDIKKNEKKMEKNEMKKKRKMEINEKNVYIVRTQTYYKSVLFWLVQFLQSD